MSGNLVQAETIEEILDRSLNKLREDTKEIISLVKQRPNLRNKLFKLHMIKSLTDQLLEEERLDL